jgi:C4-type Zn-finger protein
MKKVIRKQQSNSGLMSCPICKQSEYLVEHHINGRDFPDFDAEWNKCYICSNCHYKIHRGLINVDGWVMTTSGRLLLFEII